MASPGLSSGILSFDLVTLLGLLLKAWAQRTGRMLGPVRVRMTIWTSI